MVKPRIDPNDPYRLVTRHAGGDQQLFLCGYYPGLQSLIVGAPAFERWYVDLFDRLAEKGINYMRTCLTFGMGLDNHRWRHPYLRLPEAEGPSCQPQGVPCVPGGRFDLDRFDDRFFDYWDEVIAYAENKGVIVQACLLDGVHTSELCMVNNKTLVSSATPPCTDCGACDASGASAIWTPFEVMGLFFDYYYGANNVNSVTVCQASDWYDTNGDAFTYQEQYVEHAVERLGHHENLIWEIINEGQFQQAPDSGTPWLAAMIDAVAGADPGDHLIMPRDLPPHRRVSGQTVPSGQISSDGTFCTETDNTGQPAYLSFMSCLWWNRGVVIDGTGCAGIWGQEQPLISDNDFSVCTGTPLVYLPGWQRQKAWSALVGGGYADLFVFNVTTGDPILGLDHPAIVSGMADVGRVGSFIEQFDLALSGTAPRPMDLASTGGPAWCLDDAAGSPLIVYFWAGGTATADDFPTTGTWFDPRTGATQPATGPVYTTPSGNDWVLFFS